MSSDEVQSIPSDDPISDIEINEIESFDQFDNPQDPDAHPEQVERDETADGNDQDKQTVKPKRIIRNPQPKLNAETLKGPKGIAALGSYFDRVKFRGKGHEEQDLNAVMKTYEYWCHRLFPKFPFDTCIDRLEKLGNKKEVQTHVKRIRFDMLLEDKPIIDSSDEENNVEGFVDAAPIVVNDHFDQLLASTNQVTEELSEEQLERMRLNKERAEMLRQERLRNIREKAAESMHVADYSKQVEHESNVKGSKHSFLSDNALDSPNNIELELGAESVQEKDQEKVKESLDLDSDSDADFLSTGRNRNIVESDEDSEVGITSSKMKKRILDSDEESEVFSEPLVSQETKTKSTA